MNRFNTAGILMLLASIPVLMFASATLRAGNLGLTALGVVVALAAVVASAVLCFRAVNDPSARRSATIACGIVFGASALAALVFLVLLLIEVIAPGSNALLGPGLWVPVFSIFLALLAPIVILSGISLTRCLRA